jgi:peroxiredoxin
VTFYLEKLTYQEPDSLIKSVKYIMDKVEGNDEMFKYWVIFLTNKYAKDKRMCFEKVYVYMGEKYYLTNRATWVDSTQMVKITDRILKMKYNQCGMKAANLRLLDQSGEMKQLYDLKSKYTIMYFWDYDCGHCKKTTPVLVEFYDKYKSYGIEVFGVCTRDDTVKWKKYLHENELPWRNSIDLDGKSYFRVYYDIYSTPVIYLLDENKIIKAKRVDVPGLEEYLRFELGLPPIKSEFPSEDELEKEKDADVEH